MRKSFDWLCELISSGMQRQATSGEVFVFLNRSHDQAMKEREEKIKVLSQDSAFKDEKIDSFTVCKEAGLPEPEIKEFQTGILVTLFGKE